MAVYVPNNIINLNLKRLNRIFSSNKLASHGKFFPFRSSFLSLHDLHMQYLQYICSASLYTYALAFVLCR